jgi:hypothetical protein
MNAMPNNTDKNSSRLSGEYFVAASSQKPATSENHFMIRV